MTCAGKRKAGKSGKQTAQSVFGDVVSQTIPLLKCLVDVPLQSGSWESCSVELFRNKRRDKLSSKHAKVNEHLPKLLPILYDTLVQIAGVEPTNNVAERAIRPGVLWRKGSFGTQSEQGSRFVESMMTVVSTLKQPQRNVLVYLTAACEAALRGDAAPSLLPAHVQKAQAAA